MESFSWSDSLRALAAPCLSCFRTSKTERNDLEDLLVDSGSTITTANRDAETLSLHSNPGTPRRKPARFTKNIRLFGWNLFGRPPIRLPDDDDEDDDDTAGRQGGGSRRTRRPPPPPTTLSTSTLALDSDAAPLDSAVIESHATKHAEEEAARAERRARRRERKEVKRAALARALERAAVLDANAEFEGFPGSGGLRPPPASPFARGSEDYRDDNDEEDEDEEGDFGAGAYARRTRGGSDSGRGSDSRSRTSTSLSSQQQQAQPYNHHYISQQPSAYTAAPLPPAVPAHRSKNGKSSRSSGSKTSSSSKRSRSSPSASQSPSLASPVAATQFLGAVPATPHTAREFEGFPSDLGLHTAGIERLSSGFPSPGFGGPRNGKRDMGAFLANRGA